MSDTISKNRSSAILMRWIARIISIAWGYCALGLVWFVAGYGIEEGKLSEMSADIIIFTAFLLTLGAAIIAGVWSIETIGGTVLLADSLLVFIWFSVTPQLPGVALPILFLPPLVAGALFIASKRISKKPQEQQANPKS